MTKTAILFGGSAYNVRFSLESQLNNLIIPNNADIFVVTTRYCKRRKTKAGHIPLAHENDKWNEKNATTIFDYTPLSRDEVLLIQNTFGDRLKGFIIAEDVPQYIDYLNNERFKMMEVVNEYTIEGKKQGLIVPFRGNEIDKPDNGLIRCIVDQYHHIKKAYEMMEEYENLKGFKYDYVMRARIDFIVPEPIVIEEYTLNHDQNYLYVMGSVRRDKFFWADEFSFFSKRIVASNIFPALDKMGLITDKKYNTIYAPEENDFRFDPECQFDLLLRELDTPIVNVRIYRSSKYTNGEDGYDYFNYLFRRDTPTDLAYQYKLVCDLESDINYHLPKLREYTLKCSHITEMGVRFANSTVALLSGIVGRDAKLISYDPQWNPKVDYIKRIAKENDINFEMILGLPFNDEKTESTIENTELLFIDTDHHVDAMEMELRLHSPKVSKYIIMHDTTSFWHRGQGYDNGGGGLKLAIEPFLEAKKGEWKMIYRTEKNNGLMILERGN